MPSKKKTVSKKKIAPPAKAKAKPVARAKASAKPAAKQKKKETKKAIPKKAAAKKPVAKAASKPAKVKAKPVAKPKAAAKPIAKQKNIKAKTKAKPAAIKAKKIAPKKERPEKQEKTVAPKQLAKLVKAKIESLLLVQGTKFLKVPFFLDVGDEKDGRRKRGVLPKNQEKLTASSRPKIGNIIDTKNLVELLSQQLEAENKMYFEGCEGQNCVKCGINNVDSKFYVDKSLGYCAECAIVLGLGQSKEGVFSDAQMELMRRSMEKSMGNQDIDENNIEALGDIDIDDSLELEALLAAEEESELNA